LLRAHRARDRDLPAGAIGLIIASRGADSLVSEPMITFTTVRSCSWPVRTVNRITFGIGRSLLLLSTFTVLGGADAGAAALTLQWDPPSDASTVGYVIWYGNSTGSYTSWTDVGLLFTYRVEGLADDTPYCFAVQAYSASGETSDFSTPVCARTPKPSGGGTPPPDDGTSPPPDPTDGAEIVLYASDAVNINGNWNRTTNASAAGGSALRSNDKGWSLTDMPLASPTHAFDLTFDALANTPYRVWLRLRATGNSKWNDSVWVQFSNSLVNDRDTYRLGTTSGLLVNLERCGSCGVADWGWSNSAYWLQQDTSITFSQSGRQTMRIQTREDGVEIDQVVLSATRFDANAPGKKINDSTILARTAPGAPAPAPTPTPTPSTGAPYEGKPTTLPGTISASHFDDGPAGVAYADSTPGNSGRVFRTTDVDLQASSKGGYHVAWTAAGEWLTYTVNVKRTRTYKLRVKVASVGGGSMQLALGAPSTGSRTFNVPNTKGWQNWKTLTIPMELAAGTQTITVRFLTGNVNFKSILVRVP
jgi:hypothetical protein